MKSMPETAPAETPAAPLVRAPRIETWVDIADYPGFQARVWTNFPQRLNVDLQSGQGERVLGAARQIVLEHNGWADADGVPYPPADAADFWDAIPLHLAVRVMQAVQSQATALPNSPSARSGR